MDKLQQSEKCGRYTFKNSEVYAVVERCRHIAADLGQQYVVLTVDEALYWTKDEYHNCLIVRLGGLHTSMNCLKVIGKHIESSGLSDAWVERIISRTKSCRSGIIWDVIYARGMRIHKITIQAMWRIIMPYGDIEKLVTLRTSRTM